jgi:hypothetical protein
MATIKSNIANGSEPAALPVAQEVVSVRIAVSLLAAQVIANNVVELAVLPADCVPVGYVVNASDLDTGTPTVAFDFGILDEAGTAISTAAEDGGDEWIDGSTLAQGGGIVLHTASKDAYDIIGAVEPVDVDRTVGIVFGVGAATGAAGTIELELFYKAG